VRLQSELTVAFQAQKRQRGSQSTIKSDVNSDASGVMYSTLPLPLLPMQGYCGEGVGCLPVEESASVVKEGKAGTHRGHREDVIAVIPIHRRQANCYGRGRRGQCPLSALRRRCLPFESALGLLASSITSASASLCRLYALRLSVHKPFGLLEFLPSLHYHLCTQQQRSRYHPSHRSASKLHSCLQRKPSSNPLGISAIESTTCSTPASHIPAALGVGRMIAPLALSYTSSLTEASPLREFPRISMSTCRGDRLAQLALPQPPNLPRPVHTLCLEDRRQGSRKT